MRISLYEMIHLHIKNLMTTSQYNIQYIYNILLIKNILLKYRIQNIFDITNYVNEKSKIYIYFPTS